MDYRNYKKLKEGPYSSVGIIEEFLIYGKTNKK